MQITCPIDTYTYTHMYTHIHMQTTCPIHTYIQTHTHICIHTHAYADDVPKGAWTIKHDAHNNIIVIRSLAFPGRNSFLDLYSYVCVSICVYVCAFLYVYRDYNAMLHTCIQSGSAWAPCVSVCLWRRCGMCVVK